MPSGTLSGSRPTSMSPSSSSIDSEDETVVNLQTGLTATEEPALAETLVGKAYEQHDNENLNEAETLVGTQTNDATPASLIEPQPSTPELTTSPTKSSAWVWGGTATLIILCSIIIALTTNIFETTNNTEVASPKQTRSTSEQDNNSWGGAPGILQPTPVAQPVQKSSSTDISPTTSDLEAADNIPSASTTTISTTQPVERPPLISDEVESTKPPTEKAVAVIAPVIKEQTFESKEDEISYFVGQIKNAINANNLAPANKFGTATHYLVKLVKASPDSPFVSQARSKIAKAHLVLAARAREGERWDEAQQHLDDAFNVRLPGSYQSQ